MTPTIYESDERELGAKITEQYVTVQKVSVMGDTNSFKIPRDEFDAIAELINEDSD